MFRIAGHRSVECVLVEEERKEERKKKKFFLAFIFYKAVKFLSRLFHFWYSVRLCNVLSEILIDTDEWQFRYSFISVCWYALVHTSISLSLSFFFS